MGEALTRRDVDYRRRFAKRLAVLREDVRLSQNDVAVAIGWNREAYAKAEKRGFIPPYLLEDLAKALRVEVGYLVTGRRQPHDNGANQEYPDKNQLLG